MAIVSKAFSIRTHQNPTILIRTPQKSSYSKVYIYLHGRRNQLYWVRWMFSSCVDVDAVVVWSRRRCQHRHLYHRLRLAHFRPIWIHRPLFCVSIRPYFILAVSRHTICTAIVLFFSFSRTRWLSLITQRPIVQCLIDSITDDIWMGPRNGLPINLFSFCFCFFSLFRFGAHCFHTVRTFTYGDWVIELVINKFSILCPIMEKCIRSFSLCFDVSCSRLCCSYLCLFIEGYSRIAQHTPC